MGFHDATRNTGQSIQEGNFGQWETEVEEGAGLINPVFPSRRHCSEACLSGGSPGTERPNQPVTCCDFPRSREQTATYHLANPILSCLNPPFPPYTALALHLLENFSPLERG